MGRAARNALRAPVPPGWQVTGTTGLPLPADEVMQSNSAHLSKVRGEAVRGLCRRLPRSVLPATWSIKIVLLHFIYDQTSSTLAFSGRLCRRMVPLGDCQKCKVVVKYDWHAPH